VSALAENVSGNGALPDGEAGAEHEPFAYDRLLYPGLPFAQTHPGRLATLAALYGMDPAPPARCRVLELGCADGGNLIPMACQFPDSVFVGIDLSAGAIAIGAKAVADLGLRNLDLRAGDIAEVTPEFGTFDYIIAHGVYSWVPGFVREKILSIFSANLAPQGVGFVSYNCYPGSYLRDLTRAMMLFHVRASADPEQRVQQAGALLHALAQASNDKDVYGLVLRNQCERVRKTRATVLYHDDLDADAQAFFLYQVVEQAARHGLEYLSDAENPLVDLHIEPDRVADLIGRIPEQEHVAREQYLDFVKGRMFRDTLLCRGGIQLQQPVAEDVRRFHVAAELVTPPADLDPGAGGLVEFKTVTGGVISTDHALTKAALLHLGTMWPQSIAFAELTAEALARLGPAAESVRQDLDEEVEMLAAMLLRSFGAGLVSLEAFPPPLTPTVSERPQASRLARCQARTGGVVSNLRHTSVIIDDEFTRRLLTLLDGTRTIERLVGDLAAAPPASARSNGDDRGEQSTISREHVIRSLQQLAKLALLVA